MWTILGMDAASYTYTVIEVNRKKKATNTPNTHTRTAFPPNPKGN